ncbi:MAG: DUF5121 domain-containing protein [Bacteroidales bacterium]|nr:DUF5121 domain-containing protein [Bacteroidales bacterium]MCD8395272.1 DUF5121 domain-containing protein [Bacteroidales bacterium]
MKLTKYALALLAATAMLTSCDDDDNWAKGNPQMQVGEDLGTACFGDSLRFTVKASDPDVNLSTLKANLYFGEELVSETTVRTKVSGADYEVAVYIPYLANIPDGRAYLELTLQNVNFTKTTMAYQVAITHPDYEYLTFTAQEDGTEYRMERVSQYNYAFTDKLPQELKGYITAPAYGENGNELTWGYENSAIKVGAENPIPFSSTAAGTYTVEFNTYSFEGSPFNLMTCNGETFVGNEDGTSQVDMTLSQGETLSFSGIVNYGSYWIDPDYFEENSDGSLTFLPVSGKYRIIADPKLLYFRIYSLDATGEAQTLADDGSGALWVIGEQVGKPSVSANAVGWTTENALCMSQLTEKVYQLTVVGGKTVGTSSINFKFFGQMGWGIELTSTNFTSINSDLVGVGDGTDHDNGNLYLLDGVTLQTGYVYKFVVDLTGGINDAKFSVTCEGEQAFEEKKVYMSGEKMSTVDNIAYELSTAVNQGGSISFTGVTDIADYYVDPDYFSMTSDGDITFLPLSGYYKIALNTGAKTLGAYRLNSDLTDATYEGDGHGVWLMGWGVGTPDLDSQLGWNPGAAYSMAEISSGVYQFSGYAGPETGSTTGQRFRYDYVSMKFFGQNGWGTEWGSGKFTFTGNAGDCLKADGDGSNVELASNLEEGAFYVMTLDLNAMTLNLDKK